MDESLIQMGMNFSNRPLLAVSDPRRPGSVSDFDGRLAEEFWQALAMHGGLTLAVRLVYGGNDHRLLEAAFKALGCTLDQATSFEPRAGGYCVYQGGCYERPGGVLPGGCGYIAGGCLSVGRLPDTQTDCQ